MKQNYENYQRNYVRTSAGRLAHNRATVAYRQKLAKKWGCAQKKAMLLERQSKQHGASLK